MSPNSTKTTELTLTRSIAASPVEVYDVWIDAKSPGSPWFGAAKAIVQPVVDGLFYHLVEFEGHDWAHYGRFIRLDRPSHIEHSWVSEATRGLESIVSLRFAPEGAGTLVTLRHANLPDDDMGRRHAEGWGFVLDMIAKRFRQGAARG
ncbi:MAG: SRPBCC domain-containing protein [Hyphomicrobiales bacterium]